MADISVIVSPVAQEFHREFSFAEPDPDAGDIDQDSVPNDQEATPTGADDSGDVDPSFGQDTSETALPGQEEGAPEQRQDSSQEGDQAAPPS